MISATFAQAFDIHAAASLAYEEARRQFFITHEIDVVSYERARREFRLADAMFEVIAARETAQAA